MLGTLVPMALGWTLPPLPPSLPTQATTQKAAVPDELQVTGKVQEFDPVRQILTYTDGVAAKFGPTLVFADRLEIHNAPDDQYAIVRGNVRIEDPEGLVKARSAVIWFGPKRGPDGQIAVADHVEVDIAGVRVKAESASIGPERWEFWNVEGTNCLRPIPLYTVRSKKVVIIPGKSGTAQSPRIKILGKDIGSIPTRRFSLDKRAPGLEMPSLNFDGKQFGLRWRSGLLINDQSLILGGFSSVDGDYPAYSLVYAHTFLPASVSTSQMVARNELNERFTFSYFDNIRVGSLNTTRSHTHNLRHSITAQSIWNTSSAGRTERENFSKAIDVVYERSGPVGGLGTNFQLRGQSIRRGGEPFVERALFAGSLQAPSVQLGRGLQTDIRLDAFGITGERNTFGWLRGQAGLVYQPVQQLTLGAAYISASEGGTPDFLADRLVSKNAIHLRGDLNLGPTKISYLAKFDMDRNKWYDREYTISQVIGCFEPFIVRREFPSDYAFGVRFRLGDFFDILERRKPARTKPVPPQTISEMPKKP